MKKYFLYFVLFMGLLSVLSGCGTPVVPSRAVSVTPSVQSSAAKVDPNLGPQDDKVSAAVAKAEKEAGYKIRLLTRLPENYTFSSAVYIPQNQSTMIQYVWSQPEFTGEMLFLMQQKSEPAPEEPAAAVEKVVIGDVPATFVQGGMMDGKWESNAPVYRLRWKTGEFYYSLVFNGNEASSKGFIAKEQLITLAQQVR